MTGDDTRAPARATTPREARPVDWTVFRAMLREEWRMHANLFGRRRFAAFPLFVTLLGAAGVWGLTYARIGLGTAVAGVHALVFLLGLQTGTVGFLGRDARRNLLGDATLLVFSSRTLPLGSDRALGIFVLKDLVYYAVLFMLPLALSFLPSVPSGSLTVAKVGLLWVTLTGTFATGIAVTLVLVALSTRGRAGRLTMVGLAGGVGVAWTAGANVLDATPYAVYADPSLASAAVPLVAIPLLVLLGAWLHDPGHERPARTAGNAFARWHGRLGDSGGLVLDNSGGLVPGDSDGLVPGDSDGLVLDDTNGLVTRSLLDVHRSSGGFLKVGFSAGLLFVVSAFLVELVAPIVGTNPTVSVTFGALLGLSAFTTFNWLTQFDDPEEYLRLPMDLDALLAAKLRAFLVLSVPVGLCFLALALWWLGNGSPRPLEVIAGALLLVGLQVYLFGLVVFLTGYSANEFLFDSVLFAAFGGAIAVPLVPILVIGLVVTPVPTLLLVVLSAGALGLAAVGLLLYRLGVPRWTRAHRNGSL